MLKKIVFVPDEKFKDLGLLILRVGLGSLFMFHGYGLITGGPEKWEGLGEAMENLGITFGYTFWGFMAAFSEFFGGMMLFLGVFFRTTAFLMFFTMLVASVGHILEAKAGIGFTKTILGSSHAIEVGFVFFALMFTGPGKWSLDRMVFKIQEK